MDINVVAIVQVVISGLMLGTITGTVGAYLKVRDLSKDMTYFQERVTEVENKCRDLRLKIEAMQDIHRQLTNVSEKLDELLKK